MKETLRSKAIKKKQKNRIALARKLNAKPELKELNKYKRDAYLMAMCKAVAHEDMIKKLKAKAKLKAPISSGIHNE